MNDRQLLKEAIKLKLRKEAGLGTAIKGIGKTLGAGAKRMAGGIQRGAQQASRGVERATQATQRGVQRAGAGARNMYNTAQVKAGQGLNSQLGQNLMGDAEFITGHGLPATGLGGLAPMGTAAVYGTKAVKKLPGLARKGYQSARRSLMR